MRAVLLFSAVLHIAAVGALAAVALRVWLNSSRRKEPTVPETVTTAGALALAVFIIGTIVMWMGRSFGTALTAGLAAGLLSGLAFLLMLSVMPHARSEAAGPPSPYSLVSAASLVAALVVTEVVAFCFMIATAGTAAPWS